MKLRHLLVLMTLLLCHSAFAQSIYSIKLHLLDENTSEPVAFATASVTVKGEKDALKYTLTDEEGHAVISKLKKGTYVVKAELMGYKTFYKEVHVEKSVDLGTIKLAEDVEVLDAAKVTDVGNPIIVKKDTVEYNASSFKTSDNDMLEQLLKKLPGIEIGADGSITANGETIKKITIDGKTFFLDDPQLASKNIPAKMVEKVKVVEKKSDQASFTGIDDGEEETILDLKLRPGMAQGWFGNVMGGGGHDVPGAGSTMNDWRYQGAAMVGRFTEKSQISLVLNGNNTNNRGFNDLASGMMQGMRGGRGGNSGISTTWMGGLNGAFSLYDGDMDLAGNYLYNGTDRVAINETNKTTFMQDGSNILSTNKGSNSSFTQGHRFGVRLEHKFSENTSILFEPQFNFGGGDYNDFSLFTTSTLKDGLETKDNDGYSQNRGRNDNWTASGFLLFRQRLGKAGRTISANVGYNFNNNRLNGFNQSLTNVDENKDGAWDINPEVVNQRVFQNSKGSALNGRLVYTEPLTETLFLEANYEYSWSENSSKKDSYNSGANSTDEDDRLIYLPDGEIIDEDYSNTIYNRGIAQRAGFNFSYQKKKFRAQLGAGVNPTNTRNITNGVDTTIKVINWSPQAMLSYEISDNSNIRLFYFGRSNQPSTSQLMPVMDNSDPLNQRLGNPYLQPYFNHNLRSRFGYTNKKTFTSVNANIRAGFVQNAITSAQWFDKYKVQYSIPVNGPATSSMNANVFVNSPFGKTGLSIFSMTFINFNASTSYIGKDEFQQNEAHLYYNKERAEFDYDLFHQNHPNLGKSAMFTTNKTQNLGFNQRLRLTYRNDFVEVNLGGGTRMSKAWYTVKENVKPTWSNQAEGSMNWTIPGGINIISEARYNWYNGYTTPHEDEIILNAEITKLLFKKQFTLALKAYDILGQSKNLSITDASNYHQETTNNTLGRYVILSLTYRFGKFGGAGNQGRVPGGRPGGFGGPMGGPPRR